MKIILLFLLLISFLFGQEDQQDSSYTLGGGKKLGDLPLYLGGYFSSDYRSASETPENQFRFDDIAFLIYGSSKKFSYMSEFEFKEFYVKEWSDGNTTTKLHNKLHTERLYFDYNYDENLVLRVGKYNSPIGYWNLMPINVLRATTSSPLSSSMIYPKYTTGIDFSYLSFSDYEVKIDFLAQNNNDFDDAYNNFQIDKHYGLGVTYSKNDLSLKLNGGYFHTKKKVLPSDDIYYWLASLKYDNDHFKIMGEFGTQFEKNGLLVPYSGYIQGMYRVTEQHLPVIRFESYSSNVSRKKDQFVILGYTYRPIFPMALKAEYQLHKDNEKDKALFSFSVMF